MNARDSVLAVGCVALALTMSLNAEHQGSVTPSGQNSGVSTGPREVVTSAKSGVSENREVEASDQLGVSQIERVELSPDGALILVKVGRLDLGANGHSHSWCLVDRANTGHTQAVSPQVAAALDGQFIGWNSDSKTILYVSEAIGGVDAISSMDVWTGTSHRVSEMPMNITDSGQQHWNVKDIRVAPDGTEVAYILRGATDAITSVATSEKESTVGVEATTAWINGNALPDSVNDRTALRRGTEFPMTYPAAQLWKMSLTNGIRQRVSGQKERVSAFAWSPIGKSLAYISAGEKINAGYVMVAPSDGTSVSQCGSVEDAARLQWSPDGQRIAFVRLAPTDEVGLVGICGTRGDDIERRFPQVTAPILDAPIAFTGPDKVLFQVSGVRNPWVEIDFQSDSVREILPGSNLYSRPTGNSYSPSAHCLIVVDETAGEPQRIFLMNTRDEKISEVFDPNRALRGLKWPKVTELSWRSRDGKFIIHGALLTPADIVRNTKLPLLVYNPGGPGQLLMSFNFGATDFPLVALASEGIMILSVNSRGRPGAYGRDFDMAIHDEESYYDGPLQDVLAGVDKLIHEGGADPQRLGIAGKSYGAGLTAWAICRTNMFRAASIWEGLNDVLPWTFGIMGDPEARRFFADGPYGLGIPYLPNSRALMEAEDPLYHTESVHTPNLGEYGILALATSQGRPWYQAMQYFHVPSELVVYPRTGHGVTEPVLVLDSYKRNISWFDYWLKDRPYPDKERQKEYDAWKAERAALGDPRWSDVDGTSN